MPKSAFVDPLKTAYVSNFEFVGTIDNAPYLCLPAAIQWRESLGGEDVILKYCQTLAKEGGKLVAEGLGTEMLDNSTGTLSQCCMSNVRLPISPAKVKELAAKAGVDEAEVGGAVRDWFSKTLIDDYATFIQSLYYDGAWWARFSGQVYLELKDFEWAVETLKKLCARAEAGDWITTEKKSQL